MNLYKSLSEKPDIILMDHRMPVKNGLEATKEILKIDPNVKIIFASADTTVKTLALQAGAVAFHVKPFSMRDLFTTIEALR